MAEAPNTTTTNTNTNTNVNPPEFDPAVARTFLAPFVPDPKLLDTMPVENLQKYHGQVNTAFTAAVEEKVKSSGPFAPNWRQAIAGDNQDRLKTLERFTSPSAMFESYESLRQKMSSGELKSSTPFPEKGTPEQQNAWRAEQGIPEKPEGYAYEPPKGMVLGEIDNEFVKSFQEHAHKSNLHPSSFKASVDWYVQTKQAREEAAATEAAAAKQKTEDTLRTEWGKDYRPMMNKIEGMIDATVPADSDLKGRIMASIQADATFAKHYASLAQQLNPTSTLVPGDANAQLSSVSDWLTKADALMKSDRKAYNNSEYSRDYTKYADAYKRQSGKDWGRK